MYITRSEFVEIIIPSLRTTPNTTLRVWSTKHPINAMSTTHKRLLLSGFNLASVSIILGYSASEAEQLSSTESLRSNILLLEETPFAIPAPAPTPSPGVSYTAYSSPSVAPQSVEESDIIYITATTHPYNSNNAAHAWGGNQNTTTSQEGDATGDTHLIVNGGLPQGVYGGNYGNEGGASFTGNSYIEVLTDTPTFIAGASRLTSDESSLFDGSTEVVVKSVLNRRNNLPHQNAPEFGYISSGGVTGGFIGHDVVSKSDGTQRYNTITGSTSVLLNLQGQAGDFYNSVAGGSTLFGAVDSKIMQGSQVSITHADGVRFKNYIIGGDFNYSGAYSLALNQGTNRSDTYNKSSQLLIDSGIFDNAVFAGSFSAGGGDVVSESSNSTVTGGTFNSLFVAGHASAVAYYQSYKDYSVGALQLGTVNAHLSNASFGSSVIGGFFMSPHITSYDSELDTFIGDINLTLGGEDSQGNALGGTYKSIYGGTYNHTSAAIHVEQAAVELDLTSGFIGNSSKIYAGGSTKNSGTVTGESTKVNISSEFQFGTNINVYGGFENNTTSTAGRITGLKLLSFADSSYANLGSSTTFYDFDEVHVTQASAHAKLEGNTTLVTLDSTHLTKTGAGKVEVEAGDGRGTVLVAEGTMQINTVRSTTGTAGEIQIQSEGHAVTEKLTIARDQIASIGLSVNDVTGSGLIEAQQMVVKQEWKQSALNAVSHESFSMITGADVHLKTLTTSELHMDDSAHLHTEGLLKATQINISEYTTNNSASSPYITASDMVSGELDNVFTFNFSSEAIENMTLNPDVPYLVADLDKEALATAQDKGFVFQINGVGAQNTQQINGTTYYLGTIKEDVYIYALNEPIPEPSTATLSLLALSGLLARRRRRC